MTYFLYVDLCLNTSVFTSSRKYLGGVREAYIRISGGDANHHDIINGVYASIRGDDQEARIEEDYNDGEWHIFTIHTEFIIWRKRD